MTGERDNVGPYIHELCAATQKLAKDLLLENDKLFRLAVALNAAKRDLEQQVALLRDELRRRIECHAQLVEQLSDAEESARVISSGYVDLERTNANLASLYVASCRLHGSLDRGEVLSALKEILTNQLGAEEFAIFERDGGRFTLIAQGGIEGSRELDVTAIEDLSTSGMIQVLSGAEAEAGAGPRIIVPLKVGECVTGAIAIYRILGKKGELEWVDHEILKLLAEHAGIALCASGLCARGCAREGMLPWTPIIER